MVQRKVPPKLLAIQADHANNKFDKQRFGKILGPSSPKNQDGLTKKMKKSRPSTKRSDPESNSKNPKFINEVSLPGKPPPSTPEKQSPARRSESSPNYMKSTTSSDARKERSPVSPLTTAKKSSKSSGSGHKSAKTLTKTTSLKLGRTLTKSPSFKPARTSSSSTKKKPPQAVLCDDDVDLQRATCSSTLKETKFPSYLELSHGATESEGTSATKVCPYTYCSLNGHRHTQHPPLKSFVSARRRVLKTQKSAKLGCLLSPGRARPGGDGGKEIAIKHMSLDDKPAIQEINRSPLVQENQDGFVIEIYVSDQNITEVISSKEGSDSIEEETTAKDAEDGLEPENGEMEWEEGQYSAPSADDGENVETDSLAGDYDYDYDISLGKYSFGFDEIRSCEFDEIRSHEGPEEEERGSSESDGSFQNWGGDEDYGVEFENYNYPLPSEERDEISEGKSTTLAAIEEPVQEAQEDEVEVLEAVKDGEDGTADLELSHGDSAEQHKDEMYEEGDYSSGDSSEVYQFEAAEEEVVESPLDKTDEESELSDSEGKSATLTAIEEPVEEAQEDEVEVLEVESKCPVKVGEDGTIDSEISHGDSAEQHNEEEDYSSSGSSEFHQFEAEEEEEVVESPLDKIDDLVAMETEQDDPAELSAGVTEAELDANLADNSQAHSFDRKSQSNNVVEDQDELTLNHVSLNQENTENDADEMDMERTAQEESSPTSANNAITKAKTAYIRGGRKADEEQPNVSINLRITKCVRSEEELEDPRKFNPREPNYLPVKPDPEAEKVDLKHQMMDERKDSQEWMVDYALRQTVDRLATARKRKVALLVEAFEKVTPVPKYQQSHLRHTPAFAHTRFVQACS